MDGMGQQMNTKNGTNQNCNHYLLVTAHPDDESMFFGPTIRTILQDKASHLHILCLSDGNYNGLGFRRRLELSDAIDILQSNPTITSNHQSKSMTGDGCNFYTKRITALVLKDDVITECAPDCETLDQNVTHNRKTDHKYLGLKDGPKEVWCPDLIACKIGRFILDSGIALPHRDKEQETRSDRQHVSDGEGTRNTTNDCVKENGNIHNSNKVVNISKKDDKLFILSFDEGGVSGHPNHIDTHYGVQRFHSAWYGNTSKCKSTFDSHKYQYPFLAQTKELEKIVTSMREKTILKDIHFMSLHTQPNPFRKYFPLPELLSTFLPSSIKNVVDRLSVQAVYSQPTSHYIWDSVSSSDFDQTMIFQTFEPVILWRAMAAHKSQFVWYRQLSILFSQYSYRNTYEIHPIKSQQTITIDHPAKPSSSYQDIHDIYQFFIHPVVRPRTILFILICIKLLLIPSYRSTDFDVHRNWLALTKHVPIQEWYFHDNDGTTVHTLDYPPYFALFEYFLSSNPLTNYLLDNDFISKRCLSILPDHDNHIEYDCVVFHRMTVILSDIIFWLGAWFCVNSLFLTKPTAMVQIIKDAISCPTHERARITLISTKRNITTLIANIKRLIAFFLIVCNPGILMLDHVHFQYNGMLLGILLGSIGFLIQGADRTNYCKESFPKMCTLTKMTLYDQSSLYDLIGAILFANLLGFKHLYLTLSPFYFFYLLRHFCFVKNNTNSSLSAKTTQHIHRSNITYNNFSLIRFGIMGIFTLIAIILPFLIFLFRESPDRILMQISQVIKRLFPFQRGLCHDYWAGNVWALYLFGEKLARYFLNILRLPFITEHCSGVVNFMDIFENILQFPAISPRLAAIILSVGLMPGMFCAWKIANLNISIKEQRTKGMEIDNKDGVERKFGILHCIVFSAMSSFMLAYHVHEKAIMTAIIPMTLLSVTNKENATLYMRMCIIGHFGLFPLLFRPVELGFKVLVNFLFFTMSVYLLHNLFECVGKANIGFKDPYPIITTSDKCGLFAICMLLLFNEILHPLYFQPYGIMEFLPLMAISVFCSIGLILCWVQCAKLMYTICGMCTV